MSGINYRTTPQDAVVLVEIERLGVSRAGGTLEVRMDGLDRAVVRSDGLTINGVAYYSGFSVVLLTGGAWVAQYSGRALHREDFVDASAAANQKWRDIVELALGRLQDDPEFSRHIMRAHKLGQEQQIVRARRDIEELEADLAKRREAVELLELEVASCTELTPDQLQHARAFMAAGHSFVDAINAALVVVPS